MRTRGRPRRSSSAPRSHGGYGNHAATTAALILAMAVAGEGHDIWLSPARFLLAPGDTLVVRQLVGDELATEVDLPLLRRLTSRFELLTPDRRIDLMAALPPERDAPVIQPVLERAVDFEGLGLIVMDQEFIHGEFTREEFLEYLAHEELDRRAYEPLMADRPRQRERYARSLKSLVRAGGANGDLYRRAVGQRLEVVLLQNPYLLEADGPLDVQVLFEGRPLAGQLVRAYNAGSGGDVTRVQARSNEAGIARFLLRGRGEWLIRLVYLMPCGAAPEPQCDQVDWESYWASLTFALG